MYYASRTMRQGLSLFLETELVKQNSETRYAVPITYLCLLRYGCTCSRPGPATFMVVSYSSYSCITYGTPTHCVVGKYFITIILFEELLLILIYICDFGSTSPAFERASYCFYMPQARTFPVLFKPMHESDLRALFQSLEKL